MLETDLPPLFDQFTPLFDDYRGLALTEKGAFLVSMAAMEAGYDVIFARSQTAVGTKYKFYTDTFGAKQFFRISGAKRGARPAFFDGTCPLDTMSMKKFLDVNDKLRTKKVLTDAGVLSPFGGPANARNLGILDAFKKKGVSRVIVKPRVGSLAKGILSYVTLDVAARHIATIPRGEFIVEQPVPGREFRTFVIDGEVVSALERIPAHLFGDGQSTVGALIEAENNQRRRNPEHIKRVINTEAATYKMAADGRSLDWVPEAGERVELTLSTTTTTGTRYRRCGDALPDGIVETSLKAAKALKLRFTALDVRLDPDGRSFVLEGNGRPGISAGSFIFDEMRYDPMLAKRVVSMMFPKAEWGEARVCRYEFSALGQALFEPGGKGVVSARSFVELR